MKRILGVILTLALLMTSLPVLAAVTAAGELPIVTEPVTLTVGISEDPRITSYDDNDFTNYLEEQTGVSLEFVMLPSTDTRAKVKLMFASDDLPELFMDNAGAYLDKPTLNDYGDQGLILPLNEYIDEYGVNFKNLLDTCSNPFMLSLCTAPDGNIYFLPCVVEEYHGVYSQRSWIYEPWLEAVGMDMPTTTDEYVAVLKAFRDMDPNGNNEADEIPLTYNNETRYLVRFFMNSFIYWDSVDHMIVNEDGTVSPAYFEPEFKQGLEWMHMLVEEGLLDPSAFTQDLNTLIALMNAETPVVGSVTHAWIDGGWMDTGSQRRLDLAFMGPLTGPNGVCYTVENTSMPSIGMFVTYKCENPDVAYRLGDWMLDTYNSMFNRYGMEGRDWVYLEDDQVALNGEKAVWQDVTEVWQLSTTDIYWRRRGPHYHPIGTFETLSAEDPKMAYNLLLVRTAMELDGLQPDAFVPRQLAMNAEETEVYTELRSSIDTYLWENIAKFIVGDRSFEEWDVFQAEFEKMNIDAFVDSINTCYARMSGK